jgi:hypothetical protein
MATPQSIDETDVSAVPREGRSILIQIAQNSLRFRYEGVPETEAILCG